MTAGTTMDTAALEKALDDLYSGAPSLHAGEAAEAVVEIPFRPAPRSLFGGELTLSPEPVFFFTNKTAETTTRRLVEFAVHHNPIALPGILAPALRG
jgi:hypothetical protein